MPATISFEQSRTFRNGTKTRATDDLGVPSEDADAALRASPRDRAGNALHHRDLEPLLDEQVEAQPAGYGAGDGEVVDRAVDGEAADIAAGEFWR